MRCAVKNVSGSWDENLYFAKEMEAIFRTIKNCMLSAALGNLIHLYHEFHQFPSANWETGLS